MCARACTHLLTRTRTLEIYTHTHTYTHTHIHTHTHTPDIDVYIHVCVCVCVCVCVYVCVHIYIYMYIYIYVCVCIYTGRYEFKFIIDGVWRTDEAWPVAMDSRGIQNNVLVVRDTYTHTHTYIHYTYTHTHQYTHIHTLLAPPPHVLRRDDKCGTSQMHVYTCTDRISQYHTGHSYAYDLRIRDTRHHFRWHPPAHARMHSCTLASIIRGAQRP